MMRRSLLTKCLPGAVALALMLAASISSAQTKSIYLDLHDAGGLPTLPAGATWNQLTDFNATRVGSSITDLKDSNGTTLTGTDVAVTDSFLADNAGGGDWGAAGSTVPWAVDLASTDAFTVRDTILDRPVDMLGEITFTGLTGSAYNVSVLSSRTGGTNRLGVFKVGGSLPDNPDLATFDAVVDGWENQSVMTWADVAPDAGSLTISMEPGPLGETVERWTYLNIIVLEWEDVIGPILLGDVNLDSVVNGLDVDPFVGKVTSGEYQVEADMNEDGAVNGLDVDPFVAAVVGGGAAAVPEPSTCVLLLLGLALIGLRKRRR